MSIFAVGQYAVGEVGDQVPSVSGGGIIFNLSGNIASGESVLGPSQAESGSLLFENINAHIETDISAEDYGKLFELVTGASSYDASATSNILSSSIASGESFLAGSEAREIFLLLESVNANVETDISAEDHKSFFELVVGVLSYDASAVSYLLSSSIADGESFLAGGEAYEQLLSLSILETNTEVNVQVQSIMFTIEQGTATVPQAGRIYGPAFQSG